MKRGILFEADELELRLALTLTGDQTRLNHVRATANLRSQYLNTVRDGTTGTWQIADGFHLQIFVDRHYTGSGFHASASVQFHVWINTTDFVHSESIAYTADTEYDCKLRLINYRVINDANLGLGLRIDQIVFESDGGNETLYDSADHSGAPIEWYVGKYIDESDDFVPTPAHLPLFGLLPTLSVNPIVREAVQLTTSPPEVRDIYQWDLVASGGWRYKIGGDWIAFPVSLSVDSSDGGTCCAINHAPGLSATTTYDAQIETYHRYEKITYNSFPPGDEEIWNSEARITLIPDLERGVQRNEQYGALWERFDFPRTRVLNDVYCLYAENATPVCTTDTTNYRTVHDAQPAMVRRVTNSTSAIESIFEPTVYAPYEWRSAYTRLWGFEIGDMRERQESKFVQFPHTDGDIHPLYEYRHAAIPDSVQGLVEYIQTWSHPHWSLTLYFQDWRLGIPLRAVEAEQYWLKIRQQYCGEIAVLPESQRTQERLLPLAEPLLLTTTDDRTWRKMLTSQPTSFVGLSRFDVDSVEPVSSVVINDNSAWSASGASLAHGTGITVTPTAAGTVTLTLELESIERLSVNLCETVVLDWSGTNITAAEVRVENQQGDSAVLATTTGTYLRPFSGDAHYAGSWGQDYSAGAVNVLSEPYSETPTDLEPNGVSAATMGDPERVALYLLHGGRSLKTLVLEFTVDSTDPFTVEYPEFTRATTHWTPIPETGNTTALPATNGTLWRYGQWDWYDSGLASVPSVRPIHERSTALDYLATRDRLLLNSVPDPAGLDDWYNGEYDTLSDIITATYVFAVAAKNSAGAELNNIVRALVVNSLREVPPLAACPRKKRGADWTESGDWSLWVYTVGQVKRYYLANDRVDLYRVEYDGVGNETGRTVLTSLSSDYAPGAQWTLTECSPALTNEEVITEWDSDTVHSPRWLLTSVDQPDWSRATPFHGYSAIIAAGTGKAGQWVSYDVSAAGRHIRALSDAGEIWIGYADDAAGQNWLDSATSISGTQPCVRWGLLDTRATRWLVYNNAGTIELRSAVEGENWSMATIITTDGEYPTLVATRDGRLLIYWITDGDIQGVVYDQIGTEIISEFTAVAGVDSSPIAADEYTLASGAWHVNLLYRVSGALTVSTSRDGVSFS